MFGKGGAAGSGTGGDDLQQLLATIRAARDDKTRVEILRANVARRDAASRVPAAQLLEVLRTASGPEARKMILGLFAHFLSDDVGNYRAIVDLFSDANDRAQVASTLIAARQAEGAEAASLREDLLSLNIAPQRRRDDADGDNASEALATVGSGSMVGMAQSPSAGVGGAMDFSSDGSEGDGEGSGHGARSLGGSTLNTLNSQEVELMGTEEGEDDGCCNLSLEAAASPTLGPSSASASAGGSTHPAAATATSMGSSSTTCEPPSSAVLSTQALLAPSSNSSTSVVASASASARGAMPPPLIIPSAAAAAAASHGHTHSGCTSSSFLSAPIGISSSAGGVSGGMTEEINSLVVVGSVATTISSYDSVGSLSTIESSASAEVSQRGAGRQPFAARSSLLKPVAEPGGGDGSGGK